MAQVQTVAMISWLHAEFSRGPFLVCVPLSTLSNWEREFNKWAPQLNCVCYHGSADARQQCRAPHALRSNAPASHTTTRRMWR